MINGNGNQGNVFLQRNNISETFMIRPSAINDLLVKAQEIIRKVPSKFSGKLNKSFEISTYKNSIQRVYDSNEINQSKINENIHQSKDYSNTFYKDQKTKEDSSTRVFLDNSYNLQNLQNLDNLVNLENSEKRNRISFLNLNSQIDNNKKSLNLSISKKDPKMEYEVTFKPSANLKENESKKYYTNTIENNSFIRDIDQRSQLSNNDFVSIHQQEESKQSFKEIKTKIHQEKSAINNNLQTYNFLKGYDHIENSKVTRAKSCNESNRDSAFKKVSRKEEISVDQHLCRGYRCCCRLHNQDCIAYSRASIKINRNTCMCFKPKSKTQKMKEYSHYISRLKPTPLKKEKKEEIIQKNISKRTKSNDIGLEIFNYIQKPENNGRSISKPKQKDTSKFLNYKSIIYERIKEYRKRNYQKSKKKEKIKMVKIIQHVEIPVINKKVGTEFPNTLSKQEQKKKIVLLKSKELNANKADLYEASLFLKNSKTTSTDQYSYELYGNLSKLNQIKESYQNETKLKEEKKECQMKTYLENLNIDKYKEQIIRNISDQGESAKIKEAIRNKDENYAIENKFGYNERDQIKLKEQISNQFEESKISNNNDIYHPIIPKIYNNEEIQKVKEKEQAVLKLDEEIRNSQKNINKINSNVTNIKEDYNRNNFIQQKEEELEIRNVATSNNYNKEEEGNSAFNFNHNYKNEQKKGYSENLISPNEKISNNDNINMNPSKLNQNPQNTNINNHDKNRSEDNFHIKSQNDNQNQKQIEEIPKQLTSNIYSPSKSSNRNPNNLKVLKVNEEPTYSDDFESQRSHESYILNDNPSVKESISIQEEILPSSHSNSKSIMQHRAEIEIKKESAKQIANDINISGKGKTDSPKRSPQNQKDSNIELNKRKDNFGQVNEFSSKNNDENNMKYPIINQNNSSSNYLNHINQNLNEGENLAGLENKIYSENNKNNYPSQFQNKNPDNIKNPMKIEKDNENENENKNENENENKNVNEEDNAIINEMQIPEIDESQLKNLSDDELAELFLSMSIPCGISEEGEIEFPPDLPEMAIQVITQLSERGILEPLLQQLFMQDLEEEMEDEENDDFEEEGNDYAQESINEDNQTNFTNQSQIQNQNQDQNQNQEENNQNNEMNEIDIDELNNNLPL